MEFPEIGNYCSESTCLKLDFLPVKCDACGKSFCSKHFSYTKHLCSSLHEKDVRVPVCPLCGSPVPIAIGTSPDQTVGEHIDQYCNSNTKKIFTNWCSIENCKNMELIPFQCSMCKLNFCLRHRFTTDHDCKVPPHIQRSLAANSTPNSVFINNQPQSSNNPAIVQGNMIEDQAVAMAVALSLMEHNEDGSRNCQNIKKKNRTAKIALIFFGLIIFISLYIYIRLRIKS